MEKWKYVYDMLFSISAESSKIRQLLKDAMAEWERNTCIRFEERVNQSDYVEFYYGEGWVLFHVLVQYNIIQQTKMQCNAMQYNIILFLAKGSFHF